VALSRADRVITLPSAFRVARVGSSDVEQQGYNSQGEEDSSHFKRGDDAARAKKALTVKEYN